MMRRLAPSLAAAVAILAAALPVSAQTRDKDKAPPDPLIAEFKKFIGSEDPKERQDQVERLAKSQTVEAVSLLLTRGLTDDDVSVREKASWSLSQMTTPETRAALLAGLDHSKPEVREGVCLALGGTKGWNDLPLDRLTARLTEDRNAAVKSAAAEALGALGAKSATPALNAVIASERDETVLIACADALSLIKDPASGAAVATLLENPGWRVQVAALNALSTIRSKDSVQPVISYLKEAEGRPRQDALRALQRITKKTFGMDAKAWQGWWDRNKAEWVPPPDTVKDPDDDAPEKGYARKPTSYHRMVTISQRILFVIDISTSMETPILLKAGKKVAGADPMTGATRKIDIAREELAFTLRGMDPETKFNIIAFETDIRFWQKETVMASPGNVQTALRWILSQQARKPTGGGGLDSEGRMVGRTNSYGALRAVFGLPLKKAAGGTTGYPAGKAPRPPWDTCFFLSDGAPTEGDITNIDEILAEVERWNKMARIVINCIGMEESVGLTQLLTGLAKIGGGKCEFVGR